MPKPGLERNESNSNHRLRKITFWSAITIIPVIAAVYAGAATLGYNLPRPASHGELQVVDGKLDKEIEARLKDAIEYEDGRISRQESLREEYKLKGEPVPIFVRDELKRLRQKRSLYERQLKRIMELN